MQSWVKNCLPDEQIAHNMCIAYSTLKVWKEKYSAISASLKRGKEVVDREVENALLKRALGYTYNEVTQEADELGDLSVTKVVTKQVSPDVTAQIFWLKNRKPKEWRDRKETELSGNIGVNNPFEGLTTEELRKIARSEKT